MSNTQPTPHMQHGQVPAPPTSTTPTRAQHDFSSPSAFVNDAYVTQPNTPLALAPPAQVHSQGPNQASHQTTFPQPNMSYEHHLHAPPSIDDTYALAYTNLQHDGSFAPPPADPAMSFHGHGSAHPIDHDRTPVVSDNQQPIAPSSLPSHPDMRHNADTIRASSQQSRQPLMSPFRPFQPEMVYPAMPGTESPGFIDPSATFYPPPPIPVAGAGYYDGSPQEYQHMHVPMQPPPPQFVQMQPQMGGQIFPGQQQQYYPSGQQYDFGLPRSCNGSPTSSISSSAVSLTRSASTSSELRPARPKVKLTFEDKRNIVELHRSNSSLRQEDIARQYGVDRSTISKIILSSHRWTQPQEAQVPSVPKQMKQVGGRFPAIEAKMDEWMDQQIASGLDVRDQIAREKAKTFAKEIGFPLDRFKASAKWLDKFKDRRKAAGKPTTSPLHFNIGYYPYTTAPYPMASPMGGSVTLSRSHSAVTLSSSDSSQDQYQPSPAFLPVDRMVMARSDTDLVHTLVDSSTPSRQRSQSSPQVVDPGQVMPSSGKAVRPSPLTLQRQNSYHGTSPSPRRPAPLSRANSSQGAIRRSRPGSLAASAFGITPLGGDEAYSPLNSPSTSSSGIHSRQRSETSLTPFTNSMSVMSISPTMSEAGDGSVALTMTVPPLTPITPAHGNPGALTTPDYGVLQHEVPQPGSQAPHVTHAPLYHATMPNKHYIQPQYVSYPGTDFGPAYHHPPSEATSAQW